MNDLLALRPPEGFGCIVCDPPWAFAARSPKGYARSAQRHYACTSLDWIEALPVRDLAAPDCLLWLWATNPMLPQALHVLGSWGFRYVTAGHWAKRGRSGKLAFGTGFVLRCAGEPFLIGARGAPKVGSRSVRSVIEAPRREHSRKPDEAYAAAEALTPGVARLDMFSREARPGWTTWGAEAGKFDQVAA